MQDSAVLAAALAAAAAWVGVFINAGIAYMALRDQIRLPYRLNGERRIILQFLARNSERAVSAQVLSNQVLNSDEFELYVQTRSRRAVESVTRELRRNLLFLENKGAISVVFVPAQGSNLDPAEVYYRITIRGWRKLGKWIDVDSD